MTKEQIKQKATEYADKQEETTNPFSEEGAYSWNQIAEAYITGATETTEELRKQIEKMKCCGNCKHMDFLEPNYCMKGVFRERQYVCNKWELAE